MGHIPCRIERGSSITNFPEHKAVWRKAKSLRFPNCGILPKKCIFLLDTCFFNGGLKRSFPFPFSERQDWIREYLVKQGADPLEFIGKFTTGASLEDITEDIRRTLSLNNIWVSKHTSWQKTLNHLSEKWKRRVFLWFLTVWLTRLKPFVF